MRAYLLIFKSRLFTPSIVEQVAVSGQFELVGVGAVAAPKAGGVAPWLRIQAGFWGTWGAAWIGAATLLRALPEWLLFPRPFRRLSSLRSVCEALETAYDEVIDVNDPVFLNRLATLDLDVIVSFQRQIFKAELLKLPRLGCLNVHTGILPGYRGFRPVFWMQSRGEKRFGVTVHTMAGTIDTGSVVAQRWWRRRPGASVLENQLWSYRCAAHCIVEAVERMSTRVQADLPQVSSDTPYFKAPTKAERDAAVAAGIRLI